MKKNGFRVVNDDGIDRRGFLKCMAWAGTGMLWTVKGGVLSSQMLGQAMDSGGLDGDPGSFQFVQISDSHIGFAKEANPDVVATLQAAVARINALPIRPSLLLHTGDLSHLSRPAEFDTLDRVLQGAKAGDVFCVPGEHDVINDNGKEYLARYGKKSKGDGWYSFDAGGVHFVGLVNVVNLGSGGLGSLGREQLAWLGDDVANLGSSTPIVVFAHIPLWSVYPAWGWGTEDSAQALTLLKRFGAVTVLNGHIHQTMQKTEGNVIFHTAMSTAFPQPAPGSAPSPGPMKVPADTLRKVLGINSVQYVEHGQSLAVVGFSLEGALPAQSSHDDGQDNPTTQGLSVSIANFTFEPKVLHVGAGSTVTWTNHDDMPHTVLSTAKLFSSPVLDTDQKYSFTFKDAGVYDYICSIHRQMSGRIVVGK